MGQTNFKASDFKGGSSSASEAETQPQAQVQTQSTSSESDDSSNEEVPVGTGHEILTWVGDDKDRAQRALDAEQANPKPRISVTHPLKKILGAR